MSRRTASRSPSGRNKAQSIAPSVLLANYLFTKEPAPAARADTADKADKKTVASGASTADKADAKQKPAKFGGVEFGLQNGRVLPVKVMHRVFLFLGTRGTVAARAACRVWRAEYAPNKATFFKELAQQQKRLEIKDPELGTLGWLLGVQVA